MIYLTIISTIVTAASIALGIYTLVGDNSSNSTQRVHVHHRYEAQRVSATQGSGDEVLIALLVGGLVLWGLFARNAELLGTALACLAAAVAAALAVATRRGLELPSFLVLLVFPVAAGGYGFVLRDLEFDDGLAGIAEHGEHLTLFAVLVIGCLCSLVLGVSATAIAARWSVALQFGFREHLLVVVALTCLAAMAVWFGQMEAAVELSFDVIAVRAASD